MAFSMRQRTEAVSYCCLQPLPPPKKNQAIPNFIANTSCALEPCLGLQSSSQAVTHHITLLQRDLYINIIIITPEQDLNYQKNGDSLIWGSFTERC